MEGLLGRGVSGFLGFDRMGGDGGMLIAFYHSRWGCLLQMMDLSLLNQKYVKIIKYVSASAVPHEPCHIYCLPRFNRMKLPAQST